MNAIGPDEMQCLAQSILLADIAFACPYGTAICMGNAARGPCDGCCVGTICSCRLWASHMICIRPEACHAQSGILTCTVPHPCWRCVQNNLGSKRVQAGCKRDCDRLLGICMMAKRLSMCHRAPMLTGGRLPRGSPACS